MIGVSIHLIRVSTCLVGVSICLLGVSRCLLGVQHMPRWSHGVSIYLVGVGAHPLGSQDQNIACCVSESMYNPTRGAVLSALVVHAPQ